MLAVAVLMLIGGAAWRQKARERQARASAALFRALKQEADTNKSLPSVQFAIARGADPNARMPSLDPPQTAWQRFQAEFERIRSHQSPPRRERRVTVLTYAALYGSRASVMSLLDKGAEVDARSDDSTLVPCDQFSFHDLNPFFAPVLPGSLDPGPCCVELLADEDEHVGRGQGPTGITALMVAAGPENDIGKACLLLDAGADVNAKDEDGDTALMNAQIGSKPGDIYMYSPHVPGPDVAMIRLLLDRGADVNAQNRWGRTALMLAVNASAPGSIKLLLARGADATLKDVDGRTAYARAAKQGLTDQLQALKQSGVTH